MLYIQEIIIWTDHKNLTIPTANFEYQQVLRQKLTIEEFRPTIKFIGGETLQQIRSAESSPKRKFTKSLPIQTNMKRTPFLNNRASRIIGSQ